MKKVSVLIPCYNEEKSLPLFYAALKEVTDSLPLYEWEYLFVNDGSKDNTLIILQSLRKIDKHVNYLNLSRNFGKEKAMLAGFDFATGDCMIIMDADLQDPPTLIPQMLQDWENGWQDVYAKRNDRGRESLLRKVCSLLFYRILSSSSRFEILQNVGDFRLLDRQCIDAMCTLREQERYTKGIFCWIGFKKKEIVFDRSNRQGGESKWNFRSLFNLAIDGITSFTIIPLRIATVVGTIIAFFSFLFGLYFLLKTLIIGDPVPGFPTLIVVVLFLGGIQLMAIGIVGEYIGKIYNESKHRPVYIVESLNDEPLSITAKVNR